MNLPNSLTLSRIPLLFLIVALLAATWTGAATLGLILFIIAGITDWLDGLIARRQGLVSNFGKLMDALSDKILMIGLFMAMVALDHLPFYAIYFVFLILSREFLISGMRMMAAAQGVVLGAEKAGKQKTVTQIVAAAILLSVPVVERDMAHFLGTDLLWWAGILSWAGFIAFLLATLITVTSGLRYYFKYRSVLREK
ncbi:MAG: CDP-diacylglycerol--glycerol-3-phosphate 3-phosphatidyltransferase [Opitutales bacterium]